MLDTYCEHMQTIINMPETDVQTACSQHCQYLLISEGYLDALLKPLYHSAFAAFDKCGASSDSPTTASTASQLTNPNQILASIISFHAPNILLEYIKIN